MGELPERPGFDRLIEMAHATMRGLALLDTLHPGGGRNRRQWPHCREHLVEMFAAGVGGISTKSEEEP